MTSEFKFLAVRNWEKYQQTRPHHEKWIRSYVNKENDVEFQKLTLYQRAILDGIQRIRGELGKNIPNDVGFVERRLQVIPTERMRVGYAIRTLIERCFLVPTNQQLGFTEEIREEEIIEISPSRSIRTKQPQQNQPPEQQELLSEDKPPTIDRAKVFNSILEATFEYFRKRIDRTPQYTLTPLRKKQALARLAELWPQLQEPKEQNAIDVLKGLVDELAADDFHMGRDPKTKGKAYCDWEYIFRSPEKFQHWLQLYSGKAA